MRISCPLLCSLLVLLPLRAPAGETPGLADLLLLKETEPRIVREAQRSAGEAGFPVALYLPEGVLLEVLTFENGAPLYGVITNLAHPLDGGRTASYEEVSRLYDLSRATDLRRGPVPVMPGRSARKITSAGVLLVPDWTSDRVMAFDPATGDLLDTAFIPSTPVTLQSPKEAVGSPHGTITVSDQISDAVQDFDTAGAYLGLFAPAGGVNTSILDNIRGHAYRGNGHLVVTVASGANQHAIAEFDSVGTYIGNFVANGAGGLNGPFGILFRIDDVLISQSGSPQGVKQYDLAGAYIGQWASITSFPQQVAELPSKNIAVANFSGTGQTGVRLYSSTGTFLQLLSGVTGNRGVFQLPNGRFLTTNGAGIHELDSTTGSLIRTIVAASSLQYITLYKPDVSSAAQITSPNGGEVYAVGDTVSVTWTSTGAVDSVRLEYSTDGGTSWTPMVESVPSQPPSFDWIVPDEPTLEALVRITWTSNPGVTDVSDAEFAIVPAGMTVRTYGFDRGWHLVSVPLTPRDPATTVLFPGASSPAYAYQGGYVTRDSLDVGTGYWIKFPAPQSLTWMGFPVAEETVDVQAGWNLVGSVTDSVAAAGVTSVPPGIIASEFFAYSPLGYAPSAYLVPSRGYWVKATQAGQIILRSGP